MTWRVIADGEDIIFEDENEWVAWLFALGEQESAEERGRSLKLEVIEVKEKEAAGQ